MDSSCTATAAVAAGGCFKRGYRANAQERKRVGRHHDGEEHDENCADTLDHIGKLALEYGKERACAEHQRNGAEREEEHRQRASEHGARREGVKLHCLQRSARHEPVEKTYHERAFARAFFTDFRGEEAWHARGEPPRQPAEHAQTHQQHADCGKRKQDCFERFAEEKHGADAADHAADDGVADHAAKVI